MNLVSEETADSVSMLTVTLLGTYLVTGRVVLLNPLGSGVIMCKREVMIVASHKVISRIK